MSRRWRHYSGKVWCAACGVRRPARRFLMLRWPATIRYGVGVAGLPGYTVRSAGPLDAGAYVCWDHTIERAWRPATMPWDGRSPRLAGRRPPARNGTRRHPPASE